jgi:hypothetical protein
VTVSDNNASFSLGVESAPLPTDGDADMLSDTLHKAVAEIDRYTTDPGTRGCYSEPALAAQITKVREAIDDLRNAMDLIPAITACEGMARSAGKI